MSATARLPGIQFEVVAPPTSPELVRMDIAVFVGFAASGPIDLPVPVESIVDFEEIFGEDLILAADPSSTQPVYAYLPSAVRAFFRNGGQRCWVIRVAGGSAAANDFPILGLSVLQGGVPMPAALRARSEGSWSDGLSAGISLGSKSLQVSSFTQSPYNVGLLLQAPSDVSPGDLLRLTFPGTGEVLWLFADSVSAGGNASPPNFRQAGKPATVTGTTYYWQPLLSPPAGNAPPVWNTISSPPANGGLPVCELITVDLFVQSDESDIWSLTQLGLSPAHPRYLGDLPDDSTLYATDSPSDLMEDASHPRFPLAGPAAGGFFLPINAGAIPVFIPAKIADVDVLERDGVAQFGSNLFLDEALAEISANDLMQVADYIRYQSSSPRALHGIHAAMAVDEAALISAPDAVQRGWFREDDEALASPPPAIRN